jgi:hypothetical protein
MNYPLVSSKLKIVLILFFSNILVIVKSYASHKIPDEFHKRWGFKTPNPKFIPSVEIK